MYDSRTLCGGREGGGGGGGERGEGGREKGEFSKSHIYKTGVFLIIIIVFSHYYTSKLTAQTLHYEGVLRKLAAGGCRQSYRAALKLNLIMKSRFPESWIPVSCGVCKREYCQPLTSCNSS